MPNLIRYWRICSILDDYDGSSVVSRHDWADLRLGNDSQAEQVLDQRQLQSGVARA